MEGSLQNKKNNHHYMITTMILLIIAQNSIGPIAKSVRIEGYDIVMYDSQQIYLIIIPFYVFFEKVLQIINLKKMNCDLNLNLKIQMSIVVICLMKLFFFDNEFDGGVLSPISYTTLAQRVITFDFNEKGIRLPSNNVFQCVFTMNNNGNNDFDNTKYTNNRA